MNRLVTSLCLFAGLASAQPYGPPIREGRPPRAEIFERTQIDLSRAGEHSYDRRRIAKAQRELGDFQRKLSYGHFSRRDLDRAIGATDDVVHRGSIAPADRDILYRDMDAMRAFRAYAR